MDEVAVGVLRFFFGVVVLVAAFGALGAGIGLMVRAATWACGCPL